MVPSNVVFSIDIRHPDSAHLQALGGRVQGLCEENAAPCTVSVTQLSGAPTLDFHPTIRSRLHQAAEHLRIDVMELASTAGHDSRYVSDLCPTAMLFIQYRDGQTHNDLEHAEPKHMGDGARVLAHALFELAQ